MDSRLRSLYIAGTLCVLLIATQVAKSNAFLPSHDFNPKSIADLKEAIVKGLGLQADDIKISGFDPRDAMVGKSVAYEFHVEIDNKVMPFKLMEDVKRWEYLDLPVFQTEHPLKSVQENGLLERQRINDQIPVLAPFQLAGPMELWIQDADDMRISLPHDVDAGVLKKVILADGAVVTIKGARSVSLRHPIELPLPLNQTNNDFASGLLALAEHLQDAARFHNGPLPSLRIVGPTSLASSPSSSNRLKLKRLAPGLVELSSASTKMRTVEDADALSTVDFQEEAISVMDTDRLGSLWPVVSINGSSSNLLGFEALLSAVLGEKGHKDGSFKLLKADVSAQSYMKMSFEVVKKIREGDIVGYPEWRTKPQNVRMHFEVLGKIDGNKIVPEKVVQVNPFIEEDSVAPNVLMGNITMSKMPIVHAPPNPFTF